MTVSWRKGLVVQADAKVVHVELEPVDGEPRRVIQAVPRGKLFEALGPVKNPLAVGDWVEVEASGQPPAVERVLPRRNQLSKVASSHDPREQVLFANVDEVLVINSFKTPGFSSNRTDRILAACSLCELPASLVLNKSDLADPEELELVRQTYQKAGYPVIETAATKGLGLDAVKQRMVGRTTVMYGASGVGKSTLLNALFGLSLKVGKISSYWASGKHTTSFSKAVRIDEQTVVIDTPGIRVFRPYGIHKADLRFHYKEFAAYTGRCRFQGCLHDHEPGCALADAVEAGELAPSRYLSYVELLDEIEAPPEDVESYGEQSE
jgi:ribosome biogenesis GTPase / thiamine phosphate phosphatase